MKYRFKDLDVMREITVLFLSFIHSLSLQGERQTAGAVNYVSAASDTVGTEFRTDSDF